MTPDADPLHLRMVTITGEPGYDLPATLADGQSIELSFAPQEGRALSVKGAWVRDTLNREHTGRYPAFTPRAQWACMASEALARPSS